MDFESFITEGKVVIGEKDIQKAKALIKISENNVNYCGLKPTAFS